MGGFSNGGVTVAKIPKFCSGPKLGPKAPFGTKNSANFTENHKESESGLNNFKKPQKLN